MQDNLNLDIFDEKNMSENKDVQKEESSKEKFIRMFRSIKHLSDETKESVLKYLEKTDFYIAPASARYHYNEAEGLVKHSIHVAEVLMELTKKNNLSWGNEDSPLLIGLLHDICKVSTYTVSKRNVITSTDPKTGKNIWGTQDYFTYDDKNIQFGMHGDRSVAYLLMLRTKSSDFTHQELTCIRWHMGFSQEGEVNAFSNVIAKEPLAFWTNIADNMAALTEPVIK